MLPVNAEKCPTVVTHCHAHSATKRAPRTARLAGKVGSVVVPIYPLSYIRKNGSEVQQYCVSYYEAGRRVRRNFASIDEAKAFAEKQARAIDRGEREAARFTGDDARTLATAKTLVRETGLSIVEVCRQFVAARKKLPQSMTLVQAVEDCVARCVTIERKTVAEAAVEFLTAKAEDGCSARYLKALHSSLAPGMGKLLRARNTFCSAFGTQYIDTITSAAIDCWLRARVSGLRSRRNMILTIRTFFTFARSKGFLPKNQPTPADDVALPRISVPDENAIFTPEEMVVMLLGSAQKQPAGEVVIFLALGGFAGLRTAEILRLDWSSVQLSTGYIVIRARDAKTSRRRLIPISPNLAEWLKPLALPSGSLFEKSRPEERVHAYAKSIGVKWKQNGLRHSFISYRVAQTQDLAKVALEAGNSPAICERNYRELVTAESAAKWFSVVPA